MNTLKKTGGILLTLILLVVFAGCAGSETRRSTGTYVDDKTIATKVKSQLAADPEASALNTQVEVYDGVVQLGGFVKNEAAKNRAEEIARQVEGVKDVKNNLTVR